jgi:hypothetical protein
MKLRDILFTGMDIPEATRRLLSSVNVTTTNGMTTSEYKAYKMGVENTLNAMAALLDQDEHVVFHLNGHNVMEEFDLDELIEIVEEKEGY